MAKDPSQTVVFVVTGSIAAYKAVDAIRRLRHAGVSVEVVMTASAQRFVGRETLSGLAGVSAHTDMWDAQGGGELHIALAATADAVVVMPATADFLARMASGRADDLATAVVLSARCPVLVAPAMHPNMWSHPATRRNVEVLRQDGRVEFVGPVVGPVASGDIGEGRMAEPSDAVLRILSRLTTSRDWEGLSVLVTAGPTVEDVDPVRFLSNRSSGKMGFALAEAARSRGARVTLIAGPVSLPTPAGVDRIDVRSALSMREAMASVMGSDLSLVDVLFQAAAVADYRPKFVSPEKTKKGAEEIAIELVRNPDLLAEVGARRGPRPSPLLVGFAVETSPRLVSYARGKLAAKGCDVVVANAAEVALGTDVSSVVVVDSAGELPLGPLPKLDLAEAILNVIRPRVAKPG